MPLTHYEHQYNNVPTSSGTARMFVHPFRNTTKTFLAPHRSAEVAQSKAVSPAPSTMTVPWSIGRDSLLQAHNPGKRQMSKLRYFSYHCE